MSTYLVTGAGKGIGFSLLEKLVERGHKAIAIVRSEEDAYKIIQNYDESSVLPVQIDLNNKNLEREVSASIEEFGGIVDVLINNAGIGGSGKSLIQTDPNLVLSLFENNCLSALKLSKYCLPYLQQSKKPQVINIISRFALSDVLETSDMTVSYAYAISKGALHQLTLLMSRDKTLSNILVYSIDPGPTKTRMAREDAKLEPEKIASLILDLTENIDCKRAGKAILLQG